jgi:hypothetical protein
VAAANHVYTILHTAANLPFYTVLRAALCSVNLYWVWGVYCLGVRWLLGHPVHLIIIYGIIFWENSPHNTDIFKIQKRIIQIMTKSRSRDSCSQLFKRLEILPLHSQYIFSVLLFVVKNKDLYSTNQEIRNINTRSKLNLHLPVCNLTLFQKGAYFSGIKLFNHRE